MTSKLIVNTIEADTGISSVSFASSISMDSTSKFHFSAAGIDIGADTNINRPAAGVIGFNVNGAEKLRIDTNGHLNTSGIATASNFKTGSSNLHSTGLTVGNNFIHTTGINVGTGATIHVPSSNVLTLGTNSNERLRIKSDGNIGIGTVNPTSLLTVGARPKTTSTVATVLISPASGNASIQLRGGSPTLEFDGTGGGNGRIFTDNADLAISNGTLDGAGTELVRITSAGKLGVGNASPTFLLDVKGATTDTIRIGNSNETGHGSHDAKIVAGASNYHNMRFESSSYKFITFDGSSTYERLRILSDGNISIGSIHGAKKVHISTTGNQKVLIDPNYNNNSGGSSNAEANANNIVESILIRTSFGENAASQTNAGHKWGIKFQGYNGNDFTQATSKCAGVFAVSEDEAGGYNRNVGLTFHTSPYNTAHREAMRINTNGAVTKPYQYFFTVETSSTSKSANWSKITGLAPRASQCTGVSDGTYWSNSTQRFTSPVAGIYHFFVGGWATSASNGSRYAYTFKHQNGNNYDFIGGGNYCLVDSPMDGFSRPIKLSAGEWVELWGFSSVSTTWGGGHRFFWGGYLLG